MARIANSEFPPISVKLSRIPIRSTCSSCAQMSTSASSKSFRGSTYSPTSLPRMCGRGKARRSSLPLGVSGNLSRMIQAEGIMYSGSHFTRWSRRFWVNFCLNPISNGSLAYSLHGFRRLPGPSQVLLKFSLRCTPDQVHIEALWKVVGAPGDSDGIAVGVSQLPEYLRINPSIFIWASSRRRALASTSSFAFAISRCAASSRETRAFGTDFRSTVSHCLLAHACIELCNRKYIPVPLQRFTAWGSGRHLTRD